MKHVRTFKKKRQNKRKGRKTRVCRKHRKLHRFYSILEKRRHMMTTYKGGIGLFGYNVPLPGPGRLLGVKAFGDKFDINKIDQQDATIASAEDAKKENVKAIQELQNKTEFNTNPIKNDDITDRQKLVAHKDLTSELDRKKEEAKLNKAMAYQDKYHVASSAAEVAGKTALAATVAKVAIGALTASGVGVPAAAGIAVCLILVSKLMKKYKEMQELNILLLDMNTILTNCYYLENMINKVLTVFQIYINDFTPDKKYYRKIITVDDYYSDLNNARSCKNIAILVEENTTNTETNGIKKAAENPSDFLKKTKVLKGYNLGERIQNAKQLYIESRSIDEVILAEQAEYGAFGTVIDLQENYINIDDEDALESLLKYMVYKRIEAGFNLCKDKDDTKLGTIPDEINLELIPYGNDGLNQTQTGGKFYDTESKIIYKIGVNPDIKFRIKQKLDIIRDLLIEIDPSSAQDSMNSVELNESIDKIETKAFNKLENKKKLENEWIKYSIPSNCFRSSKCLNYTRMNLNLNPMQGDNESDLDTFLQTYTNVNDSSKKNDTLNKILTYWFGIKQQLNNIEKDKEVWKKYLKTHKAEWTQFLKKCFLKAEFYKSGKKVTENGEMKPYANYEDWVRAYLRSKTNTKGWGSWLTNKGADVKKFLGADNKTKMLMNTLNTLNALFIIINSQFEMSLKYYERALKFDYTDNSSNFTSVSDILALIGYSSRNDKNQKQTGIDGIWELCESSVSYQKFLLPPDFNEDKKAIMDQVDVADFTSDNSGGEKTNKADDNATPANQVVANN